MTSPAILASMSSEPITVTFLVIDALEALGVPYLLGGSMASALYGVPRATLDADIIADLKPEHVELFTQELNAAFYVDAESIREAIRHQRSFNVIHLQTMFKVDIFVRKARGFDQAQFARRMTALLTSDPARTAYVASVEDTILAKLEWFKIGGGVSDRQWRDILGVLKAQAERVDMSYLREWAARLELTELLKRALNEAGLEH